MENSIKVESRMIDKLVNDFNEKIFKSPLIKNSFTIAGYENLLLIFRESIVWATVDDVAKERAKDAIRSFLLNGNQLFRTEDAWKVLLDIKEVLDEIFEDKESIINV